ncbi:MAG: ATP-binding protein [Planctomycetaceae bacterium]
MTSILVVDDSATERVRIAGLLSCHPDYQVTAVSTGSAAIRTVVESPVDLVLTDMQMSDINGLELVSRLRSEQSDVPVILMAAEGSEELAVKAIRAGASSYVNKSAAPHVLREVVERVLAARAEKLSHAAVLRHMRADEYEFSLGNSRSLMSSTAAFLRRAIQAVNLCPEKELLRVGIAMEEALLNACLHGNLELDSRLREGDGVAFERLARYRLERDPWRSRQVRVFAAISPRQASITVEDEGPGFDPNDLPDPTDPENLLKPHGRGILMMRLFLDDVRWNERGNKVTMIKNAEMS